MNIAEKARVLLVEDDPHLGFLVKDILQDAGYIVSLCDDGGEALMEFGRTKVDICVLDVMLPTMDGFILAEKIRGIDSQIPFVFMTARSLKEDTLRGYALGAADYVTKPFDEEILLCKIKAVLRHSNRSEGASIIPEKVFKIGRYQFNYDAHALTYDSTSLRLTEKENEVLFLLCANLNKVVRRDDAVERIYGKRDYFLGRSFDVFISKLRKHLSADPSIQIENVYRVGFILTDGG